MGNAMKREPLSAVGKAAEQARCVPHTIPDKAHPVVQRLLEEMRSQCVPYEVVCSRAGVSWYTLRRWRRGQIPEVASLEACLNVMDLELVARRPR